MVVNDFTNIIYIIYNIRIHKYHVVRRLRVPLVGVVVHGRRWRTNEYRSTRILEKVLQQCHFDGRSSARAAAATGSPPVIVVVVVVVVDVAMVVLMLLLLLLL